MSAEPLNPRQKAAVESSARHTLVLAGAGTGKTRTIIGRAAYLISQGVNPAKIQILTFTKKAAREIVNRVQSSASTRKSQRLEGSTFHSWCNTLLTRYPNLFGSKGFTIIDTDDQTSLMKQIYGKNTLEFNNGNITPRILLDVYSLGRNTRRNLTKTLEHVLQDEDYDPRELKQLKKTAETYLKAYESKKKARKYLDYDDMLQIVAARLKQPKVLKIVGNLYDHVLVDEMQDTNPLQWELLDPLKPCCQLYCVGDDAQSIYKFRGADFKNIHSFTSRVAGSKVCKLEDNYRSTQEILDLSNWLLSKSPLKYAKKLRAVRGKGEKPLLLHVEDEWSEANWIADDIVDGIRDLGKKYLNYMALSRTANYTRELQAVFLERKIPYVTFGGRKFMESAHIKDIVAALRVGTNIFDDLAWMRFLTFWQGIGNVSASKYVDKISKMSGLADCVGYFEEEHKRTGRTGALAAVLKTINGKGKIGKIVGDVCQLMGKRLAEKYAKDWEQKRQPDLPVLAKLAGNFGSVNEFITEIVLNSTLNDSPMLQASHLTQTRGNNYVIISTIHSAKGLEADTCYVLNVSPGAFPMSRVVDKKDDIEEERRVLYVALTRPQNRLVVTRRIHSLHAQNKWKDGESLEQYFLNGLPANLVTQDVVQRSPGYARDLNEPNELDVDYGMDFR